MLLCTLCCHHIIIGPSVRPYLPCMLAAFCSAAPSIECCTLREDQALVDEFLLMYVNCKPYCVQDDFNSQCYDSHLL